MLQVLTDTHSLIAARSEQKLASLNIRYANPFSGVRVVNYGATDGQT
jgi:hypothetical protein